MRRPAVALSVCLRSEERRHPRERRGARALKVSAYAVERERRGRPHPPLIPEGEECLRRPHSQTLRVRRPLMRCQRRCARISSRRAAIAVFTLFVLIPKMAPASPGESPLEINAANFRLALFTGESAVQFTFSS